MIYHEYLLFSTDNDEDIVSNVIPFAPVPLINELNIRGVGSYVVYLLSIATHACISYTQNIT